MNDDNFIVSSECLLCNRKFSWNEIIIIKAPEWACFHIDCADKFDDDTQSKWKYTWIVHEYWWKEKFTYQ